MTTNYLKLLIESEQISDAPKLVMNESTNLKTLSEGMLYHLQNGIPFYDNIYRVHSEKYYSLYEEARNLLQKGSLILGEMDQRMIQETDIGKYDYYMGKLVPLDSPIMEADEEYQYDTLSEAEYKGKKVDLNKPHRISGGKKKFRVYTKNDKGNVVKVEFGQPGVKIAKSAAARKSFLARHHCDNPGPKWKANYWACNISRYKKQLGLKFPGRW